MHWDSSNRQLDPWYNMETFQRPNQRQLTGLNEIYLTLHPIHTESSPFDWYQIILLGDRGT